MAPRKSVTAEADVGTPPAKGGRSVEMEDDRQRHARLNGKKRPRGASDAADTPPSTRRAVVASPEASHKANGSGKKAGNGAKSGDEASMDLRDARAESEGSSNEAPMGGGNDATLSDLEEVSNRRDSGAFLFSGSTGDAEDDNASDDAWRTQLEELRQRRAASQAKPIVRDVVRPSKLDQVDDLLPLVRAAASGGGDWAPVTSAGSSVKPAVMAAVVKELTDAEALALLRECARKYQEQPRERVSCALWISQVLARRSSQLIGRRELRDTLRPLWSTLAGRFSDRHGGSAVVWSALGKWKLVRSVALARQRVQQAAAGGAGDGSDDDMELNGAGSDGEADAEKSSDEEQAGDAEGSSDEG